MPSSFVDSVPPIVKRIIDINPRTVCDIGPGWGKYGSMCREYLPGLERVDAVEVPQGRMPLQDHIYDNVITADARECSPDLWSRYDLVLMVDVIEHMDKIEGQRILGDIINSGAEVLVSTPKIFEEQHDETNPFETHICCYTWEDFWYPGMVDHTNTDDSTIDSIIITLSPKSLSVT